MAAGAEVLVDDEWKCRDAPEANDGILPMVAAVVDESVDVLTTDGVVTMEWLQTTTEGLATGWYV